MLAAAASFKARLKGCDMMGRVYSRAASLTHIGEWLGTWLTTFRTHRPGLPQYKNDGEDTKLKMCHFAEEHGVP
jgi:hypothetical protein